MFKWANKEPLQIRTSNSKAKSLNTEKSHPSSPSHSNATLNSRILTNNQNRKKILLKTNKKERGVACKLFGQREWQKTDKKDLIKLIQNRKAINMHDQPKMHEQQVKDCLSPTCRKKAYFSPKTSEIRDSNLSKYHQTTKPKKSTIKIIIPHNQLLSEFLNIYWEVRGKIWNAYMMAYILLQMGFINDMVKDRQMIKNLWNQLFSPDVLILYTFIERVMNNKVNIEQAARILDIKFTEFANLWMKTSQLSHKLTNIMSQMRANRTNRRKNSHPL